MRQAGWPVVGVAGVEVGGVVVSGVVSVVGGSAPVECVAGWLGRRRGLASERRPEVIAGAIASTAVATDSVLVEAVQ
ncbi:hypothetical protein ASG69_04555 [Rhodococcus sp. Leaf225]|nr:hypothetical protein ASG69_04555 [Rhodococcus sp. Leaf225]KQU44764.1 hypothetical protein ASH03_12585 [Rhodococcus sp. Leaf258]